MEGCREMAPRDAVRILILDDDPSVANLIGRSLSLELPAGLCELKCCTRVEDALVEMGQHPIDLLISDLRMPEYSGLELIRAVRRFLPDTQIIAMTGYDAPNVRAELRALGLVHYLPKPFDASDLVTVVRDVLDLPE
jgi:two-component system response regulator YesN